MPFVWAALKTASASYHQRLFAIRAILFMLFSFFFEVEFLATVTTFKLLASLFHFDTSLVEYCGRSRQHPTFNATWLFAGETDFTTGR
jgi:hypothetical protein